MLDATDVVEAYIAAWNETDPELRSSAVERLYARSCRIVSASTEVLGLDGAQQHVAAVVTRYIGPHRHRFRPAGASCHRGCILLRWEMVAEESGEVADWGVNTLVLDGDARILCDCQFVAPWEPGR